MMVETSLLVLGICEVGHERANKAQTRAKKPRFSDVVPKRFSPHYSFCRYTETWRIFSRARHRGTKLMYPRYCTTGSTVRTVLEYSVQL